MAKKVGFALVIVIVFAAFGVWLVSSNLDSFVKAAIEKYASAATQTKVSVSGVKITLSAGEATISGLTVGNPSGYAGDAFKLGNITMALDTSSVSGTGPVVITKIDVSEPQVTYELGAGGSNLQVIENNAKAYAASVGGSGSASPSGNGRKITINDLTIQNGQIKLSAPLLQGKTVTVPLPPIHLTGLGKNGGTTPAEIAGQIMAAITSEAARAGASALTQQVQGLVGGASGVGSQIKGLFGK
jgi:hypothetical protein